MISLDKQKVLPGQSVYVVVKGEKSWEIVTRVIKWRDRKFDCYYFHSSAQYEACRLNGIDLYKVLSNTGSYRKDNP